MTILLLLTILGFDVLIIIFSATWSSIQFAGSHFKSEQQTAVLDLHCISWTLKTSLDGPVRFLALNYLATLTPPDFDPTLVTSCFNVLFGCVKITNGSAVINQGSEEFATMSALRCLHTLSHLKATYPLSRFLGDIRQRYTRVFRSETNFDNLPFSHTLGAIHSVLSNPPGACVLPGKRGPKDPIHVGCWGGSSRSDGKTTHRPMMSMS